MKARGDRIRSGVSVIGGNEKMINDNMVARHDALAALISNDSMETDMTTSNTVSTPVSSSNLYPFTTRKEVKVRLENDPNFRKETIICLYQLQTEPEIVAKDTLSRNKRGFTSSHARNGTMVAEKILNNLTLTSEDWRLIDTIAPCYSKQMAKVFRTRSIQENPALKAIAKVFSAD